MRNHTLVSMDVLEPRRLMSGNAFTGGGEHEGGHGLSLPPLPANAGPVTTAAFNAASTALSKVQTDQGLLQTDRKALDTAIAAAKVTLATQLAPLITQLQKDESAEQTTLQADFAAIQTVYKTDGPAIQTDLTNIRNDRKTHNTAQLAIDQGLLTTDQAKLSADLTAPLALLKSDDAAADLLEQNDEKAIHDLIFADPGVAAAQTALTTQQGLYTTDLSAFMTARGTYLTDLKTPTV